MEGSWEGIAGCVVHVDVRGYIFKTEQQHKPKGL